MSGLRERQKAGRRKDILAAASLLFRRGGFAETSIEQIARRARLSAGTVYNYFGSKGDLLLALVALDGEEVRAAGAALVADPPKDPVLAVRRLLEGYVDHSLVHLDKRLWRQMMGTALYYAETPIGAGYRALDRKLAEQVASLCLALQRRGDIPAGVDCGDAGEVLFYVCNSLFLEFVADDAMALAALKRRMARQLRLVFDGLLR
ncbi:MAG TPA: TetR/AcrR family transcriptional regulator [Dongiaceae bacterium]|nr:TetR/AcrR family transcriptional regulator [Dongiaceae bacterium]